MERTPWYPLDRRLSGPQSRSGHGSEEKNSQPVQDLEPLTIQPITHRYTTGTHIYGFWNPVAFLNAVLCCCIRSDYALSS